MPYQVSQTEIQEEKGQNHRQGKTRLCICGTYLKCHRAQNQSNRDETRKRKYNIQYSCLLASLAYSGRKTMVFFIFHLSLLVLGIFYTLSNKKYILIYLHILSKFLKNYMPVQTLLCTFK